MPGLTPIPIISHCLLDGARMLGDLSDAQQMEKQHINLFREESDDLSGVAPYLFSCKEKSLIRPWLKNGWGRSWGYYLVADNIDMEALYRHFKEFLFRKAPGGGELYFRFFDPRVLRKYLPQCKPTELEKFFGPVTAIICEDEDPAVALVYTYDGKALTTARLPAEGLFIQSTDKSAETAGLQQAENAQVTDLSASKLPRKFFD